MGVASCGASTGLSEHRRDASVDAPPDAPTCPRESPTCVAPGDDPCGAPHLVAPLCAAATLTWQCPTGARRYARTPADPTTCRPFHEANGPVAALGGSLVRVPTDDGRCLWVAEEVTLADGRRVHNVAFDVDTAAPFGTCPTRATFTGGAATSVVTIAGPSDPSLSVQLTGAYRLGAATHVTYRLFRADPRAPFGVAELGSGLGRWDAAARRVVVRGPGSLPYGVDLDLGDASWADRDRAYVWGCPGPPMFLTERCVVGRLDASDAMELFAGGTRWITSTRGADGATVFAAGPWISWVGAAQPGAGLLHVFAVGFGGDLQAQRATAPEGPWAAATLLGRCDLASGDAHGYCAGPVVHLELIDPTRPALIPVTYGVGTTASPAPVTPDGYWSRLGWFRVP